MEYIVCGLQSYSFTDSSSGRLVEGTNVFCLQEFRSDDSSGVGAKVFKFSLRKDALTQDELNYLVECILNEKQVPCLLFFDEKQKVAYLKVND